jgi:hypothetical protein
LKVWDQGPGKYLHFGNRDLIRNSRWIDVLQPLDGLERFAMPSIARRERPFPQVDLIDDQRVGGGFLIRTVLRTNYIRQAKSHALGTFAKSVNGILVSHGRGPRSPITMEFSIINIRMNTVERGY